MNFHIMINRLLQEIQELLKIFCGYEVEVINFKGPSTQLTITRSGVKKLWNNSLFQMESLKYNKKLVINFSKEKGNGSVF